MFKSIFISSIRTHILLLFCIFEIKDLTHIVYPLHFYIRPIEVGFYICDWRSSARYKHFFFAPAIYKSLAIKWRNSYTCAIWCLFIFSSSYCRALDIWNIDGLCLTRRKKVKSTQKFVGEYFMYTRCGRVS